MESKRRVNEIEYKIQYISPELAQKLKSRLEKFVSELEKISSSDALQRLKDYYDEDKKTNKDSSDMAVIKAFDEFQQLMTSTETKRLIYETRWKQMYPDKKIKYPLSLMSSTEAKELETRLKEKYPDQRIDLDKLSWVELSNEEQGNVRKVAVWEADAPQRAMSDLLVQAKLGTEFEKKLDFNLRKFDRVLTKAKFIGEGAFNLTQIHIALVEKMRPANKQPAQTLSEKEKKQPAQKLSEKEKVVQDLEQDVADLREECEELKVQKSPLLSAARAELTQAIIKYDNLVSKHSMEEWVDKLGKAKEELKPDEDPFVLLKKIIDESKDKSFFLPLSHRTLSDTTIQRINAFYAAVYDSSGNEDLRASLLKGLNTFKRQLNQLPQKTKDSFFTSDFSAEDYHAARNNLKGSDNHLSFSTWNRTKRILDQNKKNIIGGIVAGGAIATGIVLTATFVGAPLGAAVIAGTVAAGATGGAVGGSFFQRHKKKILLGLFVSVAVVTTVAAAIFGFGVGGVVVAGIFSTIGASLGLTAGTTAAIGVGIGVTVGGPALVGALVSGGAQVLEQRSAAKAAAANASNVPVPSAEQPQLPPSPPKEAKQPEEKKESTKTKEMESLSSTATYFGKGVNGESKLDRTPSAVAKPEVSTGAPPPESGTSPLPQSGSSLPRSSSSFSISRSDSLVDVSLEEPEEKNKEKPRHPGAS